MTKKKAPAAFEATAEELAAQTVRPKEDKVADPATMTYEEIQNALCPHCGIHLSNGLLHMHDEAANSAKTMYEAGQMTKEYECMGCGEQFGKDFGKYVKPAPKVRAPKQKHGIKIEKVRETRNGVTRPSEGGVCAQVWHECDQTVAYRGVAHTPKTIRVWAESIGLNTSTANTQFNAWRKFNS